jgi:hypothetical protein
VRCIYIGRKTRYWIIKFAIRTGAMRNEGVGEGRFEVGEFLSG